MKKLTSSLMAAIFLSAGGAQAVTTVEHVDLTRYVGQWFEVASIPQWFQKDCASGSGAEYKVLANGRIEVVNSCIKADGNRKSTVGEAKVTNPGSNSKLRVSFAKLFGKYIYAFGGDYWIINLEPNYSYAVVGHPSRKYGWILSRQPRLSDQDLIAIEADLKRQGYDSCQFRTTVQDGGFDQVMPLCEYLKGQQ